jgi:hypothetical protein
MVDFSLTQDRTRTPVVEPRQARLTTGHALVAKLAVFC